MTISESRPVHFFDYFLSDMRKRPDQTLLYEKQENVFQVVTQRQTAARMAAFARGLSAAALNVGDRVALHAAASPSLLIAEWAVLASRGVAVIVPRNFAPEELIDTLLESKSRLVIVDRLATAYNLANAAAKLPDLRHIICVESGAQAQIPIWSWADFIDSGMREPDRSTAALKNIAEKDTALLFYFKDAENKQQATRYTHGLLLDHVSRIETMLGNASIRQDELVLTATAWEHAIGHIASCYAPILKGAIVEITYGVPDIAFFDSSPQVTVGDSMFFNGVRESIITVMRQSGPFESYLLNKALELSKHSYESSKNSGAVRKLQKAALNATIIKKVRGMLGGKLRLLIGTDDEAGYETQLFFHTFGVELIELPEEMFR